MPVMSVRTLMMRSPLRPEMRAQSSGFVVFGRSSFSLNSSRTESSMSAMRIPSSPEVMARFTAFFLARSTMFFSMAPLEKSLK